MIVPTSDIERYLLARFPNLTEDEVHDAVLDAAADQSAHASKGGTERQHLVTAAWRNCADTLKSNARRRNRNTQWFAQFPLTADAPDISFEEQELLDRIDTCLPDEQTRDAFRLWAHGKRRTNEYAKAGRCAGGTPKEMRRAGKRLRDRMLKCLCREPRIRRLISGYAGRDEQ